MGFKSWLTGRNDLYADHDKIDSVIEQLQGIKTHDLKTAKEEIGEAIQALNACTGFQQYVCNTLKADSFDDVLDASGEAIDALIANIEGKVDDMKAYSEAGFMKHAFSTALMAGAKFGEGILSVGEDLGDGVVSVIGWIAPKDSGVEKWCEKFVKKEWSHDAFNFYYKSNLAKASLFTEDSAVASAFKIAGSVTGYLALGGAISGVGGVAANSGSKVLKAAGTFAKSTTRVNTLTAAVTGMGAGTESGLRQGLDINKAAHKGVKQAAIQGALAYGTGKYGEYKALQNKNAAIEEAERKVAEAEAKMSGTTPGKARDVFLTDSVEKPQLTGPSAVPESDSALATAMERRNVAGQKLEKATKELNDLKGMSDEELVNRYGVANDYEKLKTHFEKEIADKMKSVDTFKSEFDAASSDVKGIIESRAGIRSSIEMPAPVTETGIVPKTTSASSGGTSLVPAAMDSSGGAASSAEIVTGAEKDLVLAKKALAEAEAMPVQGYNDSITKAWQERGAKAAQSIADKGLIGSSKDVFKSSATTISGAVSGAKNVKLPTVDKLGTEAGAVVDKVKATASNAITNPRSVVADAASSIGSTVKSGVKAAGIRDVGVAGATLNAVGREIANKTGGPSGDASNQFKTKFENKYNGVQEDAKTDDKVDNSGSESTSSTEPSSSTSTEPTGGSSNSNSAGQPHYSNPSGGGSSSNGGATTESVLSSSTTTTPTSATPAESITEVTTTAAPAVETPTEQPTTVDPNTTPTTPTTTQTTETLQPVENITVPISSEPTYHSGGGYSDGGGYVGFEPETTETVETPNTTDGVPGIDEEEIDISTGIDNIVKGDTITKLPVSNDKLEQKSSVSSLIPIAAGLSAAAAAGLGAKAYIDHRRNNSNEDEEFDSDEWSGDESTDFEYDNSATQEEYLDDDDYTASPEAETEKYGARNNEELADLQ